MYNTNKNELEILDFWKKNSVFERSVTERPQNKPYVFYDGPPFATGLPHYGHFIPSIMKDVVPRYWTMRGYRVERVWGWDCHGLPIENIVEKELGTKSKKDIETLGVAKFNELCRSKVLSYVDEWKKTIGRFGRWVDMEHPYTTMDKTYMESVWWVFKQLWNKGLIYEGYRSMHICPRCETTLSQQEVSEGYKDIKDLSVTAKFLVDRQHSTDNRLKELDGELFILAWTTTPWTLPGNVLLAVGADIEYTCVNYEGAYYIVAKELLLRIFDGKQFEVVDQFRGRDLVGLHYEPLFPYFKDSANAFRVVTAEFVTTSEGTGIVHIAPGFGTDDYEVFRKEGIPFIQHVGMNGRFIDAVTDFAGLHVKPAYAEASAGKPEEAHMATDIEIVKWLAHNGKLFSKQKYEHSYPHCWRCDTPLLNYATSSWFVAVTKIKDQALRLSKEVNWSPGHIKGGRFGKWLEGARDWSISRQRFWASVMPVWQCGRQSTDNGQQTVEKCEYVVIGSVEELEKLSGKKVDDLHKHIVDEVTFPCPDCGSEMRRVPDVLDTWFDSGSMPYAQMHYPFEHKEKFEKGFPAEFIAEGQDQTRAWFYYLHVLATALRGTPAFRNVIVNGIVLAEDGKKMSKKLKNYPDPLVVLEKYGADALRYYLVISPVVRAENLNFSETGVREVFNKVVNTLWNVVEFYTMYANGQQTTHDRQLTEHVLDRWIIARLQQLVKETTTNMNEYNLPDASRPIMDFILDLSQWYVRRSRDRFKRTTDDGLQTKDNEFHAAAQTLRYVLLTLSKVMAPFTPFIAEKMYQQLTTDDGLQTTDMKSVHLEMWPEVEGKIDQDILEQMAVARKIVEMGLSLRKEAGIKVRQPLQQLTMNNKQLTSELREIIADELNIKEIVVTQEVEEGKDKIIKKEGELTVALAIALTDELKQDGLAREIVHTINGIRKERKMTHEKMIVVEYETNDETLKQVFEQFSDDIKRQVLAKDIREGIGKEEVDIDGKAIRLTLLAE